MVAAGGSVDRPLGNLERYVTTPHETLSQYVYMSLDRSMCLCPGLLCKMKGNRTATQKPVADGGWNVGKKGEIFEESKGEENPSNFK